MKEKIKRERQAFCILLKSVPAYVSVPFVMAVFCMNLLANKAISGLPEWLALDCGIIVSWLAFLTMDIVTKRFGPKGATCLSLFAIFASLCFCLIMFLGSLIPGIWGEEVAEGSAVGAALNQTFGGTWYVLAGSTLAFIASAVINNFTNYGLGKIFKRNPDGAAAFFFRAYVSTAIGQFADNLIFALTVSHFFFGWTLLQCITCALTGMVAELLFEVVLSPAGYAVCRHWEKSGVGEDYIKFISGERTMKVVVTGSSGGIGRAVAEKFLKEGHEVIGIDILPPTVKNARFTHYTADICGAIPDLDGVEVLINNAGVQNSGRDIDVNLKGTVAVTEKYAFQKSIKSVLFIASSSARTGSEFPEYAASKGGVVAYMKNVALRVAEYGATSNSLSPGGVLTDLNKPVTDDKDKWNKIMEQTLIPKWATPEEVAEWAYFMTVINKSMTAQDILVDNGENAKNEFIW